MRASIRSAKSIGEANLTLLTMLLLQAHDTLAFEDLHDKDTSAYFEELNRLMEQAKLQMNSIDAKIETKERDAKELDASIKKFLGELNHN